jgi:hypothetical protein
MVQVNRDLDAFSGAAGLEAALAALACTEVTGWAVGWWCGLGALGQADHCQRGRCE